MGKLQQILWPTIEDATWLQDVITVIFGKNQTSNLANALYSNPPPASTSAAAIWEVISNVGDVSGRKWAATIFLHAISIVWLLRNDAKHNNWKSTLERAKVIFEDQIKGMIISLSAVKVTIYPHLILVFLGMA